jgi:copper chaperone NosL
LKEGIKLNSQNTVRFAAVIAAACFVAAAFLNLWSMVLSSTFYYQGLHLNVYSNRVTGDLHELNILNHYIGMQTIGSNMPEFHYIIWVLLVMALCCLAVVIFPFKRVAVLFFSLQMVLIVCLGADFFYRLYQYGHNFDPNASIKVAPFMPQIWGNYQLANFHVVTAPGMGSFLLIIGFLLMIAIIWMFPKTTAIMKGTESGKQV